MFYVKCTGRTPFHGTDYESYAVFEADTPKDRIKAYSKECAIQNATNYAWKWEDAMKSKSLSMEEFNEEYQNYISQCIDAAEYKFLTETEFNYQLDHM
jgi:hypothetical protein